ncbi:7 transmembrane receptor (secretin family) domain-containing protein [Hirsutella rhossiliensis]|uniref:7 transmembrane receptor (Secretin family) domain-containing protein n=1 Tax=Hirsutella rhossiliensis TaxID=111463 RepID=A0A9P8N1U4_9HYPO|nr:7 transmembrane receptor (Secretin family) domain-containing protein [Hirsutella rhossiliensis]KAH0966668.1 7 transmembrane receptor (Secretin family) domain-containing protein [Hirsutella rhossiliensis]
MVFRPAVSSLPIKDHFNQHQVDVLVSLERAGGSISLVALVFIFLAYALIRSVRNVQNTFIVFASVSNVGASIASIIALDGLQAGKGTALCQTQSFLFEMFMQSDPWWSLAMAINVFLVFYFRTSPDSFRRWWWLYCLICYGGPFVIALTLLLVKSPRGLIYGQATIWCWVDDRWDSIRIYTYYMLIWICIAGSFVCYLLVGYHVFRSRNQLRSFPASKSREAGHYERVPYSLSLAAILSPYSGWQLTVDAIFGQAIPDDGNRRDGFYGTVTTEVRVVHSSASAGVNTLLEPKRARLPTTGQVSFDSASSPERQNAPDAQYYSTVTSAAPRRAKFTSPLSLIVRAVRRTASKFVIDDPVKRAYLRTSLLFALSVLVTWIPSSLNRIHGWLDGSSPYEYHVATAAVLPLQGLWNFLIFFITSWRVVKRFILGKPMEVSQPSRDDANGTMDRAAGRDRTNRADDLRTDTDFDDAESGNMGSDVELRRVSEQQVNRTASR